jgi:SRSO17 transposase
LPQNWAEDRKRPRKGGVREEISFKTEPETALERLRSACGAGVACGVVLTDAGRLPTLMRHRQSKACRHLHAAMLSRKTVTA